MVLLIIVMKEWGSHVKTSDKVQLHLKKIYKQKIHPCFKCRCWEFFMSQNDQNPKPLQASITHFPSIKKN
jgi:hypothetical protein